MRKAQIKHDKKIKELEALNIDNSLENHKNLLDTIRVVGSVSMPRGRLKFTKHDDQNQNKKMTVQQKQHSLHNRFMDLSQYLNDYQAKICYDSAVNIMRQKKQKNKSGNELQPTEFEDALNSVYKAENLFPVETEGPNKGIHIPPKDENGNIVIDPTTQVKKNNVNLDFNVFKECVDMNRPIEKIAKDCQFSKEELLVINKLFAPPQP